MARQFGHVARMELAEARLVGNPFSGITAQVREEAAAYLPGVPWPGWTSIVTALTMPPPRQGLPTGAEAA